MLKSHCALKRRICYDKYTGKFNWRLIWMSYNVFRPPPMLPRQHSKINRDSIKILCRISSLMWVGVSHSCIAIWAPDNKTSQIRITGNVCCDFIFTYCTIMSIHYCRQVQSGSDGHWITLSPCEGCDPWSREEGSDTGMVYRMGEWQSEFYVLAWYSAMLL